MIATYRTPMSSCPGCRKPLDAATGFDGARPEMGDITVCAYCGAVLQYSAQMMLTVVDEEQLSRLPPDVRAQLEMARGIQQRLV